ncbi:MAG: hypothetical protein SCALA702_21720 [Melioribacteraceae bacterium]|nr:MAG: hypothetical protein SCALA702_21720 [Melioribacteraceae bacterium]
MSVGRRRMIDHIFCDFYSSTITKSADDGVKSPFELVPKNFSEGQVKINNPVFQQCMDKY